MPNCRICLSLRPSKSKGLVEVSAAATVGAVDCLNAELAYNLLATPLFYLLGSCPFFLHCILSLKWQGSLKTIGRKMHKDFVHINMHVDLSKLSLPPTLPSTPKRSTAGYRLSRGDI